MDPRIAEYQTKFGKGPFLTADAVVLWDHPEKRASVLLVQRDKWPGEGMWAFPGGFMNPDDPSLKAAALRELHEETSISVPLDALELWYEASVVGQDPDRDPRARVITHAFLFDMRKVREISITVKARGMMRERLIGFQSIGFAV